MYDNIGKKIKDLARAIFVFALLMSAIMGIVLIATDSEILGGVGLFVILFALPSAWIFSWFVYGFGEIVDKLCEIAYNTEKAVHAMQIDEGSTCGREEEYFEMEDQEDFEMEEQEELNIEDQAENKKKRGSISRRVFIQNILDRLKYM